MHYQKYVKSHWCKLIHYDGRMSFTETYDLSKLRVMRKKNHQLHLKDISTRMFLVQKYGSCRVVWIVSLLPESSETHYRTSER